MRNKFIIIHNPNAGIKRQGLLRRVIHQLEDNGASVTAVRADTIDDNRKLALDAAQNNNFDCVVAAGGDSTIRNAATGLLGTDMPLGIIPIGTGNVMIREIGVKRNAREVADYLLRGDVASVRGGILNEHPFFLMAGVGFDAAVVDSLNQALKHKLGRLAYGPPIFQVLSRPLSPLEIKIDDVDYEAVWVVFTNVSHYGGSFKISPGSDIRQPGLQAILFRAGSRLELLQQLLALALGQLSSRPDILSVPCHRATVLADDSEPAQIDGETICKTPVEIRPGSAELKLIMPSNRARI